jgi:hypothetical protein
MGVTMPASIELYVDKIIKRASGHRIVDEITTLVKKFPEQSETILEALLPKGMDKIIKETDTTFAEISERLPYQIETLMETFPKQRETIWVAFLQKYMDKVFKEYAEDYLASFIKRFAEAFPKRHASILNAIMSRGVDKIIDCKSYTIHPIDILAEAFPEYEEIFRLSAPEITSLLDLLSSKPEDRHKTRDEITDGFNNLKDKHELRNNTMMICQLVRKHGLFKMLPIELDEHLITHSINSKALTEKDKTAIVREQFDIVPRS